jgi:hypothetical protein
VPKPFNELSERLLRAGVAPRHVRRYRKELTDHLIDLRNAEERAGRSRADAEAAALIRLGTAEELTKAMVEQRQFQSWSARAPWAIFGCAPVLVLAAAYFTACFILWSGWRMFLPGANTPFIEINGLAIFYFGVGRIIYFSAPIVVGWAIGLVAARQRIKAIWPAIGLVLTALIGGSARVHAVRPGPGAGGHVSMDFAFGQFGPGVPSSIFHFLMFLSLMALPYLIWRLYRILPSHQINP